MEYGDSPEERLRLITNAIKDQIGKSNTKRETARKNSSRYTKLQLASSAVTPVILGISTGPSIDWYHVSALVASGTALFAGSMLAAFSFKDRWKGFAQVIGRLQELKLDAELLATRQGVSDDEVQELRANFQSAMDDGNASWQKTITEAKASVTSH
jgi:hypothetical protein